MQNYNFKNGSITNDNVLTKSILAVKCMWNKLFSLYIQKPCIILFKRSQKNLLKRTVLSKHLRWMTGVDMMNFSWTKILFSGLWSCNVLAPESKLVNWNVNGGRMECWIIYCQDFSNMECHWPFQMDLKKNFIASSQNKLSKW